MNMEDEVLLPTYLSHSKSYFTPPMAPNNPSLHDFNWCYEGCDEIGGDYIDYGNCKNCNGFNDFSGYDCFNFQQPRRRRPILPRSWIGRPTAPPETATTYKCSFYPKCYSKRRAIRPRNYFQRTCAPPPRCTMNQLSYTYRLRHRLWY